MDTKVEVGARVEVPPYSEAWARGARYGRVVETGPMTVTVKLDLLAGRHRYVADDCRVVTVDAS